MIAILLGIVAPLSFGVSASSGVSIVCSVRAQTETSATVDVTITGNAGFGILELTPSFPEALTLTSATNGSLVSDFTKGNQYIWIGDNDITATGTLCTLEFAIPDGTVAGDYPVSFVLRFCGNYNEEEVDVTITPCNISIKTEAEPDVPSSAADMLSYQVTKSVDDTFSLRAIAGLNSLAYKNFGYEITITTKDAEEKDVTQTLSGTSTIVYSSIYGGDIEYSIKEHFGYEYAGLATVTGLAVDSTYTKIEIRTFVTTLDGEVQYGKGGTLLYTGTLNEDGYPSLEFVTE